MEKFHGIAAASLAVLLVFQTTGYAATDAKSFSGTVRSVDTVFETIELTVGTGTETIEYSSATRWPKDVKDPSSLVGKSVKITLDAIGKKAARVE